MEDMLAPVRDWLIGGLAPRPGDTVLELSAGPGGTGHAAAAIVGPRGRVISTDFSPAMVEVARRRGAELGLRNVEYRVMDAEHIALPAHSVDGVLCRFGLMLMADPAAALSEARRVLRPGGRLGFAVWRPAERNPWSAVVGRFLVERGHLPPPAPGAPGIFSLASDERLRTLLEGAGFGVVRIEEIPVRFGFRDLDEYERYTDEVSGAGPVLRGLPRPERDALTCRLAEAFSPFLGHGGYDLPGVALGAVAA